MNTNLIAFLKNPRSYDASGEVKVAETHVSMVFLVDGFAYKLKKPVNFGFLDYSSLDLRKKYCDLEIVLNKRGAEELYLEVIPVYLDNHDYSFEEGGEIVEYLVKMHQFDEDKLFLNLIRDNKLTEDHTLRFAERLFEMHELSETSDFINTFGETEQVKAAFVENFEQTEKYIDKYITKNLYDENMKLTYEFFDKNSELFKDRVERNKIRHCHGDSHLRNVCLFKNKVQIFDCIEFNDSFMYVDTMADVAYAYMDFEVNGRKDLADLFLNRYIEVSGDKQGLLILPIYLARQSYVRGKINCFNLEHSPDNKKLIDETKKYFELSTKYLSS